MPVLPPMNTARLERMGLSALNHLYVQQMLGLVADEQLAFPKYRTDPRASDLDHDLLAYGIRTHLSSYFDVLHLKHLGVDVPGLDIPACLQRIVALTLAIGATVEVPTTRRTTGRGGDKRRRGSTSFARRCWRRC